ncbi:hypothetical protein JMN32_11125 [Fulvivirga sp. 29W222]|uniref:Glycosyltransferase subfamily 4-like N-terminal domain-containing protein n=1 Tax=Fulvivirga marina TaxID=2494733 RepID=A0A937KBX8_9BACT|nr:hypothetical protein [Fulvivirga marina]MBL6446867.1 hypothetical protein [Fulvivirga marina]
MKNLLVVSVSAPPKGGAESLQVDRYLSYLKHAFNISLLTTKPPRSGWAKLDPDLVSNLPDIKTYELNGFYNRYFRYFLRLFFKSGAAKLDYDFLFPRQWRRATKMLKDKPDVIYSRSLPFSSAVMARKLAAYYKVPWVMHLSDPWVGNPYLADSHRSTHVLNEALCIEQANMVSFTTRQALEYYTRRYPTHATKFFITPNVYKEEGKPERKSDLTSKLVFTHTGNFYSERNPDFFLQALEAIDEQHPGLLKNIQVNFVGNADEYSEERIRTCPLDQVVFYGPKSYAESVAMQNDSDVLVVIDKPVKKEEDTLFLPSKVLDYMVTGRYILAITDDTSCTSGLVSEGFGVACGYDDLNKLKNAIMQLIQAHHNGDYAYFKTQRPHPAYSAKVNSGELISKLNTLVCAE